MANRIIFDTETTGLNSQRDEILEIAFIDADGTHSMSDAASRRARRRGPRPRRSTASGPRTWPTALPSITMSI